MSLKRSDKNTNGNAPATDATGDIPKYRDNVEINAKIDAYIQALPAISSKVGEERES